MIDLGGKPFGWPWHGAYDYDNATLATKYDVTIDWPNKTTRHEGGCDCWLIRISGLPEPETTPAEITAGMAWENYALITSDRWFFLNDLALRGRVQRLYATSLTAAWVGGVAFIYIDPQNAPWMINVLPDGTRRGGSVSIELAASRFGVFGGQPKLISLGQYSIPFQRNPDLDSYYPDFPFDSYDYHASISDIAANGASLLIEVPKRIGNGSFVMGRRFVGGAAAVVQATFTGTPGVDFYVGMTLLADEAGVDVVNLKESVGQTGEGWQASWCIQVVEYDWGVDPASIGVTPHTTPAYAGTYVSTTGIWYQFSGADSGAEFATSGRHYVLDNQTESGWNGHPGDYVQDERGGNYRNFTASKKCLIGARFGADGSPDVLVGDWVMSFSCTRPAWYGITSEFAVSPSILGDIDGGVGYRASISCHLDFSIKSMDGGAYHDCSATVSGNIEWMTGSRSVADFSNFSGALSISGQGSTPIDVRRDWALLFALDNSALGPYISMNHFLPVRCSNSIVAPSVPDITQYSIDPSLSVTGFFIGPFFGVLSSKNDIVSLADNDAIYATEHPVTGQIMVNTRPVYWV